MEREKQYDMFDVAIGDCSLDDYLLQRYSENDLSSTFWVEKTDEVDELRAPKPGPDGQLPTEPEVIPIQGPRAQKASKESSAEVAPVTPEGPSVPVAPRPSVEPQQETPPQASPDLSQAPPPAAPMGSDGRDTVAASEPATAPALESFQHSEPPVQEPAVVEQTPEPVAPPSMEDLLARFHQATREYEERSQSGEKGESDVDSGSTSND